MPTGAIGEWMYADMVGIAKDPENPGFKHFFLQPKFDPTGKITEVEGSYVSPYGKIRSAWQVSGDRFHYRATVPPNSTATLRLPAETSPGLASQAGVEFLGTDAGMASYRLESGIYTVNGTLS